MTKAQERDERLANAACKEKDRQIAELQAETESLRETIGQQREFVRRSISTAKAMIGEGEAGLGEIVE